MLVDSTVSALGTQITLSALSVLAIQKMKSSSWFPWIHGMSDKANKFVSVLTGLASAIGIHLTWAHGALPGSYMLGISGLTLIGVASGVWAVTKSVVFNELIYRSTVKTQTPGAPAQVIGAGAVAKP